ncbi:CheR family methyltransferase [Rubellicoccus peritrichatus]|uniref:CheR family methyltransferase n=1 Tax=Rubellicoccus peritrichatus TaxID=3080537 RepID=A0AAQ3L683_9BACT|nr:CheR family methyltransferase [Puniceicoccus sp. CR14]WOO39696.1 CheR family methyltransferase [Puniceicoccus sp. CR14]
MSLPPDIADLLAPKYGLDPSICTGPGLVAATRLRMEINGLDDEFSYYDQLRQSGEELDAFVEELLIPESWFFRDRVPFDFLKSWVTESWLPTAKPEVDVLRVLSLPCAAGQEPYSIAITLLEAGLRPEQFSILSGDLSPRFVEQAREGTYRSIAFRGEDYVEREKYFEDIGEGLIRVRSFVRNLVSFKSMNLVCAEDYADDGPFQLIFCRNVLIYFNDDARRMAFEGLERSLTDDGVLFAGHADAIFRINDDFGRYGPPGAFCYSRRAKSETEDVPDALPKPQSKPLPAIEKRRRFFQTSKVAELPKSKDPVRLPSADSLTEAKRLADSGQLEDAERICRERIDTGPASADACFLLGEILLARKEVADADAQFRRTVYLDKSHRDALFRLALLAEQRGDSREAGNWRRRAANRAQPSTSMTNSPST